MLSGFKTVGLGLGLAIVPTAVDFLTKVDWNAVVGTKWAFAVSGALMIVMRFLTTTPIGVAKDPAAK